MKPFPKRKLTLDQRAQHRLKRLEKRRLKAMPLFVATGLAAQIEPLPSLHQIKHDICRWQQDAILRHLKSLLRGLHDAHLYQILVTALVSPIELHRLMQRRHIYPSTPEYAADFWRRTHDRLVNIP